MDVTSLEDLFIAELCDMYDAEKQLTEALPKMAKKASNEKLAKGFETHLKETEGQIERIEKVAEICGFDLKKETCKAMKGLVKEGEHIMEEVKDPQVLDAALITAAQKVEHYEIASYGSLCSLGKCLGLEQEALDLLEENLNEEKETDEKLTMLAEKEGINDEALEKAA